jgi:hypothetical protein
MASQKLELQLHSTLTSARGSSVLSLTHSTVAAKTSTHLCCSLPLQPCAFLAVHGDPCFD